MNRIFALTAAVTCIGVAADMYAGDKPGTPILKSAQPHVSFTGMPLSFEPNLGQSDPNARFVAKNPGYTLQLESTGARFQFDRRDKAAVNLRMDLENANRQAAITGESRLLGKDDYFPTKDPKSWVTNVPTYSRVHYSSIYPGIDLAFYGNANRLEYDFLLQAGADPAAIGMKLSGAEQASVDAAGDLLLRLGKGEMRFLKPVAYQTSINGKRENVQAGYRLERSASGKPVLVSFSIGSYDRSKPLVIDPVAAPSLVYSEYLSGYAGAVAVDSSGNTYVAGTTGTGFNVTKFNSSGTVVYNASVGSGGSIYPYAISIDSTTGQAYVAGQIYSGSTLPTSANAYQSTYTAGVDAFLVVIAAGGSSVPYATYLGGTDSNDSYGQGIAVDSNGNAYLTGYTSSANFPTTSGAYQSAFTPSYDGFVSKINPAASTGPTSLVYSTLLGPGNTYLYAIAVDSSGDAYVTGNGASGFPVTSGAFQYSGIESTSGGVYVTKLNPTGTALVYSAYLGYGTGYGIALDGQASPSAYVTGTVSYPDFPTTAGAYQTSYAGGFVTKLNSTGSSEVYSTFLGGPSSYLSNGNVFPTGIALPNGCSSSCSAYVAGWTNTADFPTINAVQTTPSSLNHSGFVTEIAASGASALFSSYLNGVNSGIYSLNDSLLFGTTPSIAVDSSGNMSVVGNIYSTSDFPISISNANPTSAFLAKISLTSASFTLAIPSAVDFGNQPIGVSTSISNGTVTVRLDNLSATTATLSITVSPSSIFSESDNCDGSIPGGGFCVLNLNFAPSAPGARSGTVTVTSNASNSPMTIPVSGTGVDQPYITASPTSLVFGNQATGTSSAVQTVTLTNLGDQSVALTVYTNTADFSELNTCPSQLAPGSSCIANVKFSPTQPGLRTDNLYFSGYGTGSIPLSGSGTVAGSTTGLSLSATSIGFGNQVVNTTSPIQAIVVTNNGTVPVAIQSVATTVSTGNGNFAISSNACGNPTGQLDPQATCEIDVTFTPTAAGTVTGTLTINDSTASSPHTVSLSGTGLTSTETFELYPGTTVIFPDTIVGVPASAQVVYAYNTGTTPIAVDRVLISGDFQIAGENCSASIIAGTLNDGSGSYSYCNVNVTFTPTVIGARTGTLTFIDSATGSPHTVSLSGNGIAITGSLALTPTQLYFPTQATGTTSAAQLIQLINPGDTPITVTGYSATSNFAVADYDCGALPVSLAAGGTCNIQVTFTPTAAGNPTGTLTVNSSAGNQTVSLSGTAVTASLAIGTTPTVINFGSVVTGQMDPYGYYLLYLRNTGTEAVALPATVGTLSGGNAGDFSVSNATCPAGGPLQPNTSCYVYVSFTPGAAGARSTTLKFVDSAGTQSVALSGTGVATLPASTAAPTEQAYDLQVQGTTSPTSTITFNNNSASSVTVGTVALTAGFLVPSGSDRCSLQPVGPNASCSVDVSFAPTTSGYITGTLTIKNSGGTTLISVPVAGYAPAPANSAYLDPTALNFTNQVVKTPSAAQTLSLYNSGNLSLTVGTVNSTDAEYSISPSNGGSGCSNQQVLAGNSCSVDVTFTPSTAGARPASLTFPVTYADSSTANLTASLAGTGIAERNSAVLSPTSASFLDQTVGITSANTVSLSLTNSGNVAFTVGTLTGTNAIVGASVTGEFSTAAANGGSDGCSNQLPMQPGSTCNVYVAFTPSMAGVRTGSITFPVKFPDSPITNFTATLSGKGIAATKGLQITPLSIQFPVQIQGTTSAAQTVTVTNTGNAPISFGTDTVSGDFQFVSGGDNCVSNPNPLPSGQSCSISVTFKPSTTGARPGTLTIADNAGGPHSVPLSGTGIPANQQIVLSQATVAFGNQPAGSTSSTMVVYVTNQSDTNVSFSAITLAGTNPTDFTMTNSCPVGSSLGPRTTCTISIAFAPLTGTSGALSAMVTVTDSDSGSPRTITLTGTAVAPGPAAALAPASGLTFVKQNVGTSSPAQNFSVTNTGSANLTITNVASTDSAEFAISSDGCSGATVTSTQQCVVSVSFSPSVGGTRSGTIKVTDNASGSPQSLAVTGTGYGIPSTSLTPTSLAFGNQNIGTTSAAQTVTLKNAGTDTLAITGISLTGIHAGDYTQTNTCPASLAPAATCVITVTFKPTAAGTRGASVTVTDNAGNLPGSTQNAPLTGTGVAVPTAGVSPTTLTFSSTNIGVTSAAQTTTITNSGSGPLTITSIVIGGTNAADYAETNSCGSTLVAGSNCTISVTFTPSAAGTRTATITITDNSNNVAGATQTVSLTGTGAGLPGAAVNPSTLTFTDQNVGTTSAAQTVTLSNSGSAALTIASIAIGGTNASDFATTNNCAGSVAAGSSCSISVTFKPGAPGNRGATLTVTDNAGNTAGSKQTVALTGTGVGVPVAGVSPSSLSFGNASVGITSSAQPVTLSNSGTGPLTISNIVIGGTNPGDFAQTNNCGTSLAVAGSCTISVTFTPASAGSFTASLHILDNSNNVGATQSVSLSGTGVMAPVAGVSPNSLTFAAQAVGTTSSAQTVTLSNSGNAPLAISNIGIGGTNSSDFAQTNNCGTSLAAAGSCTISVTFTPAATGARSATLTVTDNSGNVSGATQSVTLSGTGGSGASAKYNGADTATQGTWTGKYGADGYLIANDATNAPAYATVSLTGDTPYTWTASTTDPRALQVSSGSSNRIASAYYSYTNFTIDVNLTDGNAHRIALYLLDWSSTTRTESVSILDASSNAVLDTETFSGFHNGEYAAWNVKGHVLIQVKLTGGTNAVVSGIFFDPASTPSASATYNGLDTTTEGTWTGKYGADGYLIANDATNAPGYATVSLTGDTPYTWVASTTDPRALQVSSGSSNRIASTYYSYTNFTVDVNLTDGNAHPIALYLLDWSSTTRTESVSILDASSNAVLDTETFSGFHNGEYAAWNVKGHVLIRVTLTGGTNAVVSGIFFK